MLINLKSTDKAGFPFTLPYLSFDNATVAVTECFIKFSEKTQVHGYITSSLIDRTAFNPNQIIFTFSQQQESIYVHCKPTHLQTYKIQLTDFRNADIKLHLSPQEKTKKIEEFFVQLKIIDAGIQQGPEHKIQ